MDSLTIRKRWNLIWKDNRSFFERLKLAGFPCFLISFTLLMFGPLDIIAGNARFLSLTCSNFILPYLMIMAGAWIVLSVVISLFRGKIYDFLLCLLIGIAVCMYLQGTFLNLDLGALDGSTIAWHLHAWHALFNLVIWFAICLAFFALHYFVREHFTSIMMFVCVLLTVMQTAGLVSALISTEEQETKTVDLNFSGEEEYVLSNEENVIVFVLDAFSNKIMNDILTQDDTALDGFHDFTYYDNMNTGYVGTFPGELHLLTGWKYQFEQTYEKNFANAWASSRTETIYGTLKENGYESYLYSNSPNYLVGSDFSRVTGVFSNMEDVNRATITLQVLKKFVELSLYRYVPHTMKPNFWMYSGDIQLSEGSQFPIETNHEFYPELKKEGLSKASGNKRVIFYMLTGAHVPYTMDRYGKYVPEGTNSVEQARGYLYVVQEYMEQLKELGLYDSSTIVVTADHGDKRNTQSILLFKEKNRASDVITRNSAPINQSEVMPTILKSLSLPVDDLGVTAYDIDPDAKRERVVHLYQVDENYPPQKNGKYNIMQEYTYVGNDEDAKQEIYAAKDEIYAKEHMKVHILLDSFY